MTRPDSPARIDAEPDVLRDAEEHSSRERSVERAQPADDHRLECVEQQRRPVGRGERRAHAVEGPGDRDERERDARRDGVDAAMIEAHQLRRLEIVAHRAEGPAERGAVEKKLQRHRQPYRHDEDQCGQHPDRHPTADLHARRAEPARLDGPGIGRVDLLEQVLDDDGEAEGDDQRGQRVLSQRSVQHRPLQAVARREADRQQRQQRDPGRERRGKAESERQRGSGEGAEHDEVAVRGVGEAHDPEDQRLAEREERVHPSEEDSLHDGVEDPRHQTPKYARETCSAVRSAEAPSRVMRPSCMQTRRRDTVRAMLTSCSTIKAVRPLRHTSRSAR